MTDYQILIAKLIELNMSHEVVRVDEAMTPSKYCTIYLGSHRLSQGFVHFRRDTGQLYSYSIAEMDSWGLI